MTTPRTRGTSRLVAGLATTGLLTAGLTCFAAPATAATASGPLGFTPAGLTATADGTVVVAGNNWDTGAPGAAVVRNGVVDAIEGLPADATVNAVLAQESGAGSVVLVAGSDGNGAAGWTIDLTDPDPTAVLGTGGPAWDAVTAVGGDEFLVLAGTDSNEDGDTSAVAALGADEVVLAEGGSPTAATTDENGTAYVVGTGADGDAGELWIVGDDAPAVTTVEVGDQPRAVVAADGVAYVAGTAGEQGVIQAVTAAGANVGTADLGDATVSGLAMSADRETLYAAAGYSLYAIPVDGLADFDADGADVIESDDWLGALAIATQGDATALFSSTDIYDEETESSDSVVVAFGGPAAPVVTASVNPSSPTTLEFTVDGDAHGLRATVTGPEAEVVFDGTLETYGDGRECSYDWDSEISTCWIEGLDYGTTYDLVVTATNFLGSTGSDTQTVSTLPLLAGPSTASFTGTAQVGQNLTAVTSTGWPAGTALEYGWSVNGGQWGTYIPGRTLALAPNLAGTRVTLMVTGTKDGFAQRVARSAAVAVAAAPVVQLPALPGVTKKATAKVAGTPQVGKVVKANVGTWPKGTKVKVQWYANGKPIKGATKKKLKLGKKLKGKKITVVVTGTKPGYAPKSKKSKPTKVRAR